MKKIIISLLIMYGLSFAHPFLNINSDEDFIYLNIRAKKESINDIFSIKPVPYFYSLLAKKQLNFYLNSLEKPEAYLKPLNTLEFNFYTTNADALLLEGKSGLKLKKGFNAVFTEDGQLAYKKNIVAYYQLRQILNKDEKKGKLLRGYVKFIFGKLSFEAGKDNVDWGPSEYGMLLSKNAYPFPLIKLQTEKPLKFFGKWKFSILNGWLNEKRKDVSNPKILGIRVVYKPADFIEIGGTKTTMYSGNGRPGYKLTEYWDVLTSSKDNIPGDKYDNDSYAGYDISLFLPLKYFDIFQVYYQEVGTDIQAIWQKEDRKLSGRFPFIFGLLSRGYQYGIFLSKGKNILRLEYSMTPNNFYIHHWYYYEGYTYKGFSLGHPYGRNFKSYYLKFIKWINSKNWIDFRFTYYKQPNKNFSGKKTKNYILSLEYGKVLNKYFQLKPFVRYDYKDGVDKNPLPTQFSIENKTKSYVTIGLSLNIRF